MPVPERKEYRTPAHAARRPAYKPGPRFFSACFVGAALSRPTIPSRCTDKGSTRLKNRQTDRSTGYKYKSDTTPFSDKQLYRSSSASPEGECWVPTPLKFWSSTSALPALQKPPSPAAKAGAFARRRTAGCCQKTYASILKE